MYPEMISICQQLLDGATVKKTETIKIYTPSIRFSRDGVCFLARMEGEKALWSAGGELPALFYGKLVQQEPLPVKKSPLDVENAQVLLSLFPELRPGSHQGKAFTMGFGDRLGLATPGQLRAIRDTEVFPVLAQQSMRELELTGRTYDDVFAAAVYGVLETGWNRGWGADGDHLKTAEEVAYALECGFTMITLDCSEQIDGSIAALSEAQRQERYNALPEAVRTSWEERYLNAPVPSANPLTFPQLQEIVLTYYRAVDHAERIYHTVIQPVERTIDVEMSIDETETPTSPQAHYVVGSELLRRGVMLTSLAPRFCGEFQKGIDYKGDLDQFKREFHQHTVIAQMLGYKISVHSGSDKFAVFPIVGQETDGKVHVKTAGTSWLEAVRLIAQNAPDLYRRMHTYAIQALPETSRYYVIDADPARLTPLETMEDSELPGYMDQPDARQILHIAYGVLLTARDDMGKYLFRDELFDVLNRCEERYYQALEQHLGRHVSLLRTQ